MLCVGRLGVIVPDVTYMFPVSLIQISASLSYVRHFTCTASEFVNSTRVVVLVFVDRLRFCILLYCVCVFECNFYVLCLKRLVSFLIFGLQCVKVARFLFSSLSCVWLTFSCFICTFRSVTKCSGKLLFCAMVFIVFHSVCCLSIVSASDCILFVWYR